MAKLSTSDRKNLPRSAFVFPDRAPGPGSYPIPNARHARIALTDAAGTKDEAAVKRAVKARFPRIKVGKAVREALAKMQAEIGVTVPVWKDDARQLLYTVVLSPGIPDSQGDTVSATEIEKAAHGFMTQFRKHDVQHDERPIDAVPVESYVAPVDFEVTAPDGTVKKVLKGAWVMAIHVRDRPTWERCSKADHPRPLTGVSIGGSGVRIPDAA